MAYTEVTHQGWFGRIGGAIKGVVVGLILVVVATGVLGWNEWRTASRSRDLQEGGRAAVVIDAATVAPANEGKLVLFSARAAGDGTLRDEMFGLEAPRAIKLRRIVEMYQWKERKEEKRRNRAGGTAETVTTYHYAQTWSDAIIDSQKFHESSARSSKRNPTAKRLPGGEACPSRSLVADRVTAGAFVIPASMLEDFEDDAFAKVPAVAGPPPRAPDAATTDVEVEAPAAPASVAAAEAAAPAEAPAVITPTATTAALRVRDGMYYGGDPDNPQLGDLRIRLEVLPAQDVTVLGKQVGDTLAPYVTKGGRDLVELRAGAMTKEQFFERLAGENAMLAWILRAAGFIFTWVGLALILNPLKVLGDVVPIVGSVIGAGIAIVSFLAAAVLSLTVIAVAWLLVRPVIGVTVLCGAIAVFVLLKQLRPKGAASRRMAPPPPVPPPPPPPPPPVPV